MIRKLVFVSAVVAGGLFLLNNCWSGSVGTAWKRARATVERKISPDFELARIRDQIQQLTPDMHKNIAKIAEEMVAVESLERRVGDLQARLDREKGDLASISDSIEKGIKVVLPSGRPVTASLLKDKLKTCKNLERELVNQTKVLDAKRSEVISAREQLAEMRQQKEQMEVLAAEYEAELKTLALEQTRAKIKLDDSRLAEIKDSFEKLRERIDVARKTSTLAGEFNTGTLSADKKAESAKDVVDEVKDFLADKPKAEVKK